MVEFDEACADWLGVFGIGEFGQKAAVGGLRGRDIALAGVVKDGALVILLDELFGQGVQPDRQLLFLRMVRQAGEQALEKAMASRQRGSL